MQIIQLPRHVVNQILQHAQHDTQAWGSLLQQADHTLICRRLTAPADLQQLKQGIAAEQGHLWGVYHTQYLPEELPRELLEYLSVADAHYFSVQLNTKGVLEVCAFQKSDTAFVACELELIA